MNDFVTAFSVTTNPGPYVDTENVSDNVGIFFETLKFLL